MPYYAALRRNIELKAELDLKDRLRWPESLPATIMTHNQTPHAAFQFRISPFEVMFGRRAWYRSSADEELPWLIPDFNGRLFNNYSPSYLRPNVNLNQLDTRVSTRLRLLSSW